MVMSARQRATPIARIRRLSAVTRRKQINITVLWTFLTVTASRNGCADPFGAKRTSPTLEKRGVSFMRESVSVWVTARLSTCGKCMHRSFISALLAVGATTAAWVWLGLAAITVVFAAIGFALSLLWIVHIIAYVSRASARSRRTDHTDGLSDPSRRALLPTFARVVIGVAIATALPARFARADVTWSSSEWCCRHDFSRQGNPCVGCCPK
jgi:hypothetical protein